MTRWRTFWCNVMGWHKTNRGSMLGFDGASMHARCIHCGYQGMIDSQGNLF